jgi:hypothetical protein
MRAIRGLAVAALVALDVGVAAAQSTRHFKDSWFWGVKGGAMLYQVQSDPDALSAMGGVDWLITRTKGGLYVSFDHLFFNDAAVFVNDSISPLDTVPRMVVLNGMRRFTIAGMFFPLQSYRMHPYFGMGATLSHIARAEPVGTFRNATQQNLVLGTIQALRSTATPIVMIGTQVKLTPVSAFVQLTASPAHSQFFLFTGNNWRSSLEVGVRYNAGSSIDRLR